MGLDMYLHAKKYVEKINWEKLDRDNDIGLDSPEVVNPLWNEIVDTAGMSDVATDIYGVHVEVTCAYWRKANQIHKWFVDNVQDGKDDCGSYYVSKEKLQQLLDACEDVLEDHSKAKDLLPVSSGFFFGSYEYDDWYFDSLHQTVKICQEAIKLMEGDIKYSSFYYQSSW